ncbi:4387_t:CDS:2, partial [Funneliformis geosporum]
NEGVTGLEPEKGGLDTEGVVGRDLLEEENAREILDDCNLLGVLGDDDSVTVLGCCCASRNNKTFFSLSHLHIPNILDQNWVR